MARNISETGIATGELVLADQILQLTDALRGDDAFNLSPSGNFSINGVTYPAEDGATSGSVLITDGSGTTGFGIIKSVESASFATTASFALVASSSLGIQESASYAVSASHAQFADVAATALDQTARQYTQSFNTDAREYTFTHNLSFKYVLVQAYDTSDEMIVPATVRLVDANNVFVRFANPQNGTIVIQK
jgi:hypothetical protein